MRLRAADAPPSVALGGGECGSRTEYLVRIMKCRLFGMMIAAAGAITVAVAVSDASAGPRSVSHAGAAPAHSAPFFHHHHRPQGAVAWPGDDSFDALPYPETLTGGVPPGPDDGTVGARREEIPWDWVHRYPPSVAQSDRSHAPGCRTEAVSVPDGRGGKGEVNVTQCY